MAFAVIICVWITFSNTVWRPYFYVIVMTILGFMGFFNGYVTSRYLKFFGTTDMWFSTTVSAVALPLYIVGALIFEMIFAWIGNQAMRYSFFMVGLRTIGWYILHATLCYYGAFAGYVEKVTPPVVPIGKVIRPIPPQPTYLSIYVLAPIFGFI